MRTLSILAVGAMAASLAACGAASPQIHTASVTSSTRCEGSNIVDPTPGATCVLKYQDQAFATADAADRADSNAPDFTDTVIVILHPAGGHCVITQVTSASFGCKPIESDIFAAAPDGFTRGNLLVAGRQIYIHREVQ